MLEILEILKLFGSPFTKMAIYETINIACMERLWLHHCKLSANNVLDASVAMYIIL